MADEHKLCEFENKMLRKIHRPKEERTLLMENNVHYRQLSDLGATRKRSYNDKCAFYHVTTTTRSTCLLSRKAT